MIKILCRTIWNLSVIIVSGAVIVAMQGCGAPVEKTDVTTAPKARVILAGRKIFIAPEERIVFLPTVSNRYDLAPETLLRVDLSQRALYLKAGQPSEPLMIRIRPYARGNKSLVWGGRPLSVRFICSGGVMCSATDPIVFNDLSGTRKPVEFAVQFNASSRRLESDPAVRIEFHYQVTTGVPGDESIAAPQFASIELDLRIPVERLTASADDDNPDASGERIAMLESNKVDIVRLPVNVSFKRKILTLVPVFGTDAAGRAVDPGKGPFSSERLPDDINVPSQPTEHGALDTTRRW